MGCTGDGAIILRVVVVPIKGKVKPFTANKPFQVVIRTEPSLLFNKQPRLFWDKAGLLHGKQHLARATAGIRVRRCMGDGLYPTAVPNPCGAKATGPCVNPSVC